MGKVYGLTGGIASGKSSVAAELRALGAPVIDADEIARVVVAPGSDGLAELVAAFGEEILTSHGELDRKKLGALVFEDSSARAILNRITHPRIAAESQRRIGEHLTAGAPVVIYEAALIVENSLHKGMDGLIVVAVPEDVQLQRLCHRDGIDLSAARARLAAQLSLADKVAVADHVIDNAGTREATRAQVHALWQTLLSESR